jgi:hypothetical protein
MLEGRRRDAGRRRALGWFVAGAVAYAAARVWAYAGGSLARGADSYDFLAHAALPMWSREFAAGVRPFGYPLLLDLVGRDATRATVVALVVGIAAFIGCAAAAAHAARRAWGAVAAATAVGLLGLALDVVQWDRALSSDGLSVSIGVALFAALWWGSLGRHWGYVAAGALAVLWGVLRDSNGAFLGVVGAGLALVTILRWRRAARPALLGVALVFVAVASVASWSAAGGGRADGPLKDVVTMRVLADSERARFFIDRGLPLTDAEAQALAGRCVSPRPVLGCVTFEDPAFYRWIREDGRRVYLLSMVRFPFTTLTEPARHLDWMVGTRVRVDRIAAPREQYAPLSRALEPVVFVRSPALLVLWSGLLAVGGLLLARRGRWPAAATVPALALALVPLHLWLVWAGGQLEVTRHSLAANVQLRLGLWLTTVLLVEAAACARTSHGASVPEPGEPDEHAGGQDGLGSKGSRPGAAVDRQ